MSTTETLPLPVLNRTWLGPEIAEAVKRWSALVAGMDGEDALVLVDDVAERFEARIEDPPRVPELCLTPAVLRAWAAPRVEPVTDFGACGSPVPGLHAHRRRWPCPACEPEEAAEVFEQVVEPAAAVA